MADPELEPPPAKRARRTAPERGADEGATPASRPAPSPRKAASPRQRTGERDAEPASPAERRARAPRLSNQIAPAPERGRGARAAKPVEASEVEKPGGPTHRPGDVPTRLTRRYFTEALRGGATVAFYEGPGAKKVAFHDHGSRLATDGSHPAVIRDLALIAAHRGWRSIQVKGADEFRRELWLEARALGLEVKGYTPRERDQQELDRRAQPQSRPRMAEAPARTRDEAAAAPERPSTPPPRERPDFDVGVSGVLLASGEAPYRRRVGHPSTPFVRIDRGDGRVLDVWGAGLPQALTKSGAQLGDVVQVRREGVHLVQRAVGERDPQTGQASTRVREVGRDRWVIEAERFRRASPSEAARDAQLRGAQSHVAVLNTVIDRSITDPEGRARLRAEARSLVADELARGRRFTPARIREIEPVLARDIGSAKARRADADPEHRR